MNAAFCPLLSICTLSLVELDIHVVLSTFVVMNPFIGWHLQILTFKFCPCGILCYTYHRHHVTSRTQQINRQASSPSHRTKQWNEMTHTFGAGQPQWEKNFNVTFTSYHIETSLQKLNRGFRPSILSYRPKSEFCACEWYSSICTFRLWRGGEWRKWDGGWGKRKCEVLHQLTNLLQGT